MSSMSQVLGPVRSGVMTPWPARSTERVMKGQDRFGNLDANASVEGKRWSAWTDAFYDQIAYRENGLLILTGHVDPVADPTRENYTFNGVDYNWANQKAYAPYLVQWHRIYDNADERRVRSLIPRTLISTWDRGI